MGVRLNLLMGMAILVGATFVFTQLTAERRRRTEAEAAERRRQEDRWIEAERNMGNQRARMTGATATADLAAERAGLEDVRARIGKTRAAAKQP